MKARRLIVLAVIACVATAVMAASGQAAGEIGPWAPATVTCDSMAHQIKIQPNFGAGTAYESQRLAYTLYLYKQTSQGWVGSPLPVDGQTWKIFTHNRLTWYYDANLFRWMQTGTPWAQTPEATATRSPGNYFVFIQYAWEVGMNSNAWYDRTGMRSGGNSPWEATTGYFWPGLAGTHVNCIV